MDAGLKNRALRPVFLSYNQHMNPTDRSRCPACGKRWNNDKKVNFGRVKCSIA